jgi:alcohol dehydrogenase
MKAVVYRGKDKVALEDYEKPTIKTPTDAIIKLKKITICGTDLHISQGHVATCAPGTILGHEGIGIVEEIGNGVSSFKKGQKVLISCISSCGTCEYCKRAMQSHCTSGGWILGNTINGTQAEYVRIPHADSSLYAVPEGADEAAYLIFPTGFECGVLRGQVQPGTSVAVVGAGPVGLAAMITAQLYSPALTIMIDTDPNRLETAKKLGATVVINPKEEDVTAKVKSLTEGKGCDTVIEAVGIPATFEQCQHIIAPGGTIANVGVHGTSTPIHLETLWDQNINITTQLVDAKTTPMFIKLINSGKLDPAGLVTHHFKFSEFMEAYKVFGQAAQNKALKVMIDVD